VENCRNVRFAFGSYFAHHYETFCEPSRRFYKNEVYTPYFETRPLLILKSRQPGVCNPTVRHLAAGYCSRTVFGRGPDDILSRQADFPAICRRRHFRLRISRRQRPATFRQEFRGQISLPFANIWLFVSQFRPATKDTAGLYGKADLMFQNLLIYPIQFTAFHGPN